MKIQIKHFNYILVVIFAFLLLQTAWLSDDSFISFRTVDNFVHGYGLRWNISERVQSFTHPLWVFLLSGFYAVSNEIFYTSILVSVLISLIAVILLVYKISISPENSIIILLIAISSKALMDYSTSGLENPLTHLLLVVYAIFFLKKEDSLARLFNLSFITSLVAVNRIDAAIILIPALLYSAYRIRTAKTIFIIFIGFLPFVFWEIFSLIYYGFPFPNTAYAKLSTGISSFDLAKQGLKYFLNSIKFDPVTLPIIIAACIIPFIFKTKKLFPLSVGILLYLIYIIKIGGDFMTGRFFSAVLVMSIIIISNVEIKSLKYTVASIFIIIVLGLASPYPNYFSDINYGVNLHPLETIGADGIADERAFYFNSTSLIRNLRGVSKEPPNLGRFLGNMAKNKGNKFIMGLAVGFLGYYSGPNVHIIDLWTLNDALLARLPAQTPWRIGHFRRRIPLGYLETILDDKNKLEDKSLAQYYDILHLINSGPVFNSDRLKKILEINIGKYDNFIKAFNESKRTKDFDYNFYNGQPIISTASK